MIFLNLKLFDGAGQVVNTTGGYTNVNTGEVTPFQGNYTLSPGMKDFYKTEMLENSRPQQYFAQFAEKLPLPKNNGMTLERRKWNVLAPAMKALTEGVNPKGERMGQSTVRTSIHQYGSYVEISDVLETHHVDNTLLGASEELGAQHGQTEDLLVRNALCTGTNIMMCDVMDDADKYVKTPQTRWMMEGKAYFTPATCAKIRTKMVKEKVPKIGNSYVGIMHPSVAEGLTESDEFKEYHKYAAVTELFNGEIGELKGVRFVETTNAPVYVGGPLLNDDQRYLTVSAYAKLTQAATATTGDGTMYEITVKEALTQEIAEKLIGRYVLLEDVSAGNAIVEQYLIMGVSHATKKLYLDEEPKAAPAEGDYLTPGEGGAEKHDGEPVAVYGTFIMGKNGYAIIDPEGAGFEMIAHDRRIAGGPLELKSTVGWKMSQGVLIQYPERILRVESTSPYSHIDVDVLDEVI